MITDLLPWIKDGIVIRNINNSKYEVFTIPTQHFTIYSLSELTPSRFELEVIRQKRHEKMQTELMKLPNL